jgi:hypothetical protein
VGQSWALGSGVQKRQLTVAVEVAQCRCGPVVVVAALVRPAHCCPMVAADRRGPVAAAAGQSGAVVVVGFRRASAVAVAVQH